MLSLKRCFCVLLFLLIAIISNAQQSTPITLKELLNRVGQKAPALLTDSSAILIRRAQAAETRNNWLPHFRLNYQADVGSTNNTTGPYFGYGIIPSSSGGIHTTSVTTAMSDNLGIAAFDWE